MKVELRHPVLYLVVAAVLSLAGLAWPAGDPAPPTGPAPAGMVPVAPAGCSGTVDSLRPAGSLPGAGAMPAGTTMARIAARGRLIAGVDQSTYLLGFRNPATGQLEGADIDVTRQLTEAIFGDPNRVQYVVLRTADRVAALQHGQVDVVVSSFAVTCERQRSVAFSAPYRSATTRVLVSTDSGLREVEDLAGRRVCASAGSTQEEMLRSLPTKPDVVTLPAVPDCMVALQRGQVSAVVSAEVILAGLAAQDPQVHVVGRSLLASETAVGISLDAPDLVRFVNGVLERARADGSLDQSVRRWFGQQLDPLPQPPPTRYRD